MLTGFPPQDFKILAGIRSFFCSELLIAKFPMRKNPPTMLHSATAVPMRGGLPIGTRLLPGPSDMAENV